MFIILCLFECNRIIVSEPLKIVHDEIKNKVPSSTKCTELKVLILSETF